MGSPVSRHHGSCCTGEGRVVSIASEIFGATLPGLAHPVAANANAGRTALRMPRDVRVGLGTRQQIAPGTCDAIAWRL